MEELPDEAFELFISRPVVSITAVSFEEDSVALLEALLAALLVELLYMKTMTLLW